MDCQHTLESQLLANVKDYIKLCLGSLKGMTDEKRKLFAFVLTIVIGGNNIDWKIPQSVASVCDILGVGKTTVYEYRNLMLQQWTTNLQSDKDKVMHLVATSILCDGHFLRI